MTHVMADFPYKQENNIKSGLTLPSHHNIIHTLSNLQHKLKTCIRNVCVCIKLMVLWKTISTNNLQDIKIPLATLYILNIPITKKNHDCIN